LAAETAATLKRYKKQTDIRHWRPSVARIQQPKKNLSLKSGTAAPNAPQLFPAHDPSGQWQAEMKEKLSELRIIDAGANAC
jgi:hypothetical protein